MSQICRLRVSAWFEAAHSLEMMPDGHPCQRTHGHRYEVTVEAMGSVDQKTGVVITYEEMLEKLGTVLSELDHRNLNDVRSIGETTTENLCRWVWKRLHQVGLNRISEVKIQESPNTCCVFRNE